MATLTACFQFFSDITNCNSGTGSFALSCIQAGALHVTAVEGLQNAVRAIHMNAYMNNYTDRDEMSWAAAAITTATTASTAVPSALYDLLATENGLLMAVGCAHTFMTVNDLLNALRTAAASCGKQLTVVQQHTGSRQLKNNDAPIEDDTTTSNSLLTATKLQEISTTAIADADSSSG
eukprot:13517-Heterococcus_DN1.PRE.1